MRKVETLLGVDGLVGKLDSVVIDRYTNLKRCAGVIHRYTHLGDRYVMISDDKTTHVIFKGDEIVSCQFGHVWTLRIDNYLARSGMPPGWADGPDDRGNDWKQWEQATRACIGEWVEIVDPTDELLVVGTLLQTPGGGGPLWVQNDLDETAAHASFGLNDVLKVTGAPGAPETGACIAVPGFRFKLGRFQP